MANEMCRCDEQMRAADHTADWYSARSGPAITSVGKCLTRRPTQHESGFADSTTVLAGSQPQTVHIEAEGAVLALGPQHLAVLCGDQVRRPDAACDAFGV